MSSRAKFLLGLGSTKEFWNYIFCIKALDWRVQTFTDLYLAMLLSFTQDFWSTDPRDKVFAVIGVSREAMSRVNAVSRDLLTASPKGIRNQLLNWVSKKLIDLSEQVARTPDEQLLNLMRPDSNKPVQEVYCDITRYLICQ